jgi:hypothetical protein
MSTNTDWLDKAVSKYLTGRLAQFRASLEEESGQPINAIETDAALLLSDLCRFLGLDEEQHNYVLGGSGVRHVNHVLETQVAVRKALSYTPHKSTLEVMRT